MQSVFAYQQISESVFNVRDETLQISASSYYSPNLEAPFRAIFGPESSATEAANQWTTATQSYLYGQFTGTYSCCVTLVDDQSIMGEWLQVQSSVPHAMKEFSIMSNFLNPMRAPKAFVLAGSKDGIEWTLLHRESDIELWEPKQTRTFQIGRLLPLTHFRLIVSSTAGMDGWLTIDKLHFYGD